MEWQQLGKNLFNIGTPGSSVVVHSTQDLNRTTATVKEKIVKKIQFRFAKNFEKLV
jgi:hypothetical protein